jgi:hypothetical protein
MAMTNPKTGWMTKWKPAFTSLNYRINVGWDINPEIGKISG